MIEEIIGVPAFVLKFLIVTLCVMMAFRYRGTKVLGISFAFLGVAFAFYGVAELLWYHLDSIGVEPHHNWPDLFYIGYYGFAILHIVKTLNYFKSKGMFLTRVDKAWGILVVALVVIIYMASTFDAGIEESLYGLPFVLLAATLLTLAFIATMRLYDTGLSRAWILIGLSILITTFVDVPYYVVEVAFGYDYGQYPLIDIGWAISDMLMILGIFLHRKLL